MADLIRQRGPIPLVDVVDAALYDGDGGFYATGGRAGRRGDFITSPEIGPLFGAVLARAIDAWWDDLGRPDPFVVVDAGAGPGTLAVAVLAAEPAVRAGAALRARRAIGRASATATASTCRLPWHRTRWARPRVPVRSPSAWRSCRSCPGRSSSWPTSCSTTCPSGSPSARAGAWLDVLVGLDPGESGFAEVLVPADPAVANLLDRVVPDAPDGARVPVQFAAAEWLRRALLRTGQSGRVVVLDYATTTAGLAGRPQAEWLRTYRSHQRGGALLDTLGRQDITCEVAVDQLALVRRPDVERTQAEFLAAHGIDDLVEAGRRTWEARAGVGDLEAIKGRSRVGEAEALLDPVGARGVPRARMGDRPPGLARTRRHLGSEPTVPTPRGEASWPTSRRPAPPSRTTSSRTARSRRPPTSRSAASSPARSSTTMPTRTTRASGPARRPTC